MKSRRLFQCTACRRQTWLIAGTIFAATKVPLRTWFRAISHLTQTKQGISSIELDYAYLGGERPGGKRGRGSPGKTSFLAAVETSNEGKPVRLKLRRVTSFCGRAISGFAKQSLAPNCKVVSDGLACFAAVAEAAMRSSRPDPGAAAARTPAFKWVNTALGNIKAAITGTYRSISQKHVPRYLAEFEYRFNRRYDLAAMLPRLTKAAAQTPPMPYRPLKLAEKAAYSGLPLPC